MKLKRGVVMIKKGVKDLVEEAEANIETMTVQEVIQIKDDNNTLLVDKAGNPLRPDLIIDTIIPEAVPWPVASPQTA